MLIRPQMSPSRVLQIRAREPLNPGTTSDTVKLEFAGGDGWLVGMSTSFDMEPRFYAGVYVRNMIAVRILINDEPLTENGRGVDFVLCDDIGGEQHNVFPLCRRVSSTDNLYVTWRHVGDPNLLFPVVIVPYVAFRVLRDSDYVAPDLDVLAGMVGPSGG